jgi:hypothetical protein
VVSKAIRPATSDTGTAYEVRYRATLEGEPIERLEEVDVSVWESLDEGARVTVHYLPGERASRLAPPDDPLALSLAMAAGALLAVPGAWLLYNGVARVRRKLRLYEHGLHADALVTDIRESNVTVNKRRWWVVAVRYRDFTGRDHDGTSDPMPWSEASVWTTGETAVVKYDTNNPGDFVFIGK